MGKDRVLVWDLPVRLAHVFLALGFEAETGEEEDED